MPCRACQGRPASQSMTRAGRAKAGDAVVAPWQGSGGRWGPPGCRVATRRRCQQRRRPGGAAERRQAAASPGAAAPRSYSSESGLVLLFRVPRHTCGRAASSTLRCPEDTLGGMAFICRRRRSPMRLTPASDTGRQPTPDNGSPHSGPRMRGVENRVPEAGPQGVCQIQSRREVGVARRWPECRPARAWQYPARPWAHQRTGPPGLSPSEQARGAPQQGAHAAMQESKPLFWVR